MTWATYDFAREPDCPGESASAVDWVWTQSPDVRGRSPIWRFAMAKRVWREGSMAESEQRFLTMPRWFIGHLKRARVPAGRVMVAALIVGQCLHGGIVSRGMLSCTPTKDERELWGSTKEPGLNEVPGLREHRRGGRNVGQQLVLFGAEWWGIEAFAREAQISDLMAARRTAIMTILGVPGSAQGYWDTPVGWQVSEEWCNELLFIAGMASTGNREVYKRYTDLYCSSSLETITTRIESLLSGLNLVRPRIKHLISAPGWVWTHTIHHICERQIESVRRNRSRVNQPS